jgi:hypothetical protein
MSEDEFALAQGEKLVMSPMRGLVGWMNDNEGVNFLLGHQPSPTDNLTQLQQTIGDCRAAVDARPLRELANPIRELDQATVDTIQARPDIQAAFAPLQWTPAMVDLREVLSYQQAIHLDGLEARVSSVSDNLEELIKFCLPINEPISQLGAIMDADQKGYTISSLNPNLRIQGSAMHDTEVSLTPGIPPILVKGVTFFISLGASYLLVARYKNRHFIRDGYHRAAGLLKKGVNIVPCILVEARNTDELGLKQGLFSYEVIYGDRPPRLSDFWDDTVAHDGKTIAMRHVLRIRGEEFNVQR